MFQNWNGVSNTFDTTEAPDRGMSNSFVINILTRIQQIRAKYLSASDSVVELNRNLSTFMTHN